LTIRARGIFSRFRSVPLAEFRGLYSNRTWDTPGVVNEAPGSLGKESFAAHAVRHAPDVCPCVLLNVAVLDLA